MGGQKPRKHASQGVHGRAAEVETTAADLVGPKVAAVGQTTRRKGCGLPDGTNKHNAGKLRCTRPSSEYPLVSVSALLRLAEWQLAQQALAQGGEPCQHRKRGGRGSFEPAGAHQDWPETTVGNAARGIAAADSNHAQSHRDAASATTFQAREGGDA